MKKYLLIFLLTSFGSLAKNIIAVQSTSPDLSKSDYSLSLIDTKSSDIIHSTIIAENLNKTSHWFLSDSGKYFVFYMDQRRKKKGRINIYQSNDLKLVSSIETEKLLIEKKTKIPYLLKFNQEENQLIFLSKFNSKTSLVNIFNLSNQNLQSSIIVSNKIENIYFQSSHLFLSGKKGSEGWFSIINLDLNKVIFNQKQKRSKYRLYINQSQVVIIKESKHNQPQKYSVQIFDLKESKIIDKKFNSINAPQWLSDQVNENAYFAVQSEESIKVYQVNNETYELIIEDKTKAEIKNLYILPSLNQLALLKESNDELFLYSLNNFDLIKTIKIPIEFDRVLPSEDNNLLWLKGKKLAVIDLESGETIAQSSIGSTGAKFQKVIVGVTMAAISTSLAYAVFKGDGFDNIDLIHNSNKDKVFVSSSVTNDISIFTSPDLKQKNLYNVRNNVYGLFKNTLNQIFAVSESSIIFFDENEFEPFKVRHFQKLLGLDLKNLISYVLMNNKIQIISLETAITQSKIELKNVIEVFIP